VSVRFLPDIRYGSENYPEKVARRLRALNLITWITAAVAIFFAVVDFSVVNFVDPKSGLWKAGVVAALGASIWASVPLLHRFGTLWGALTFILTLYAYLFACTCLFGTDSGLQMGYLLAAVLVVVLTESILLSAVLGVLAVLLVVVLQHRAARLDGAVYNFRWRGHCDRGLLDDVQHFCPPRSCAG